MKSLGRKFIIKLFNFIDFVFKHLKVFTKNQKNIILNIYSLHSTRPEHFNEYKSLIQYINKKSKFIDPSEIDFLLSKNYAPGNYSLLTFDDGYKDNYEFALKVLKDLNIKAIFFIIPAFIEEENQFSQEYLRALYPYKNYKETKAIKEIFQHMNFKQIVGLKKNGHLIGLHGLNHENYGNLKSNEISENIKKSINKLKDSNIKTNHFAYPFGSSKDFTSTSHKVLSNYFRYIYTGRRGINQISNYSKKYTYIFKRDPISTHKSNLIYFPVERGEIYFFSFNNIIKFFYKIKNKLSNI